MIEQPLAAPSLAGRRIVVTRGGKQADDLAARLRALGAEPILCPTITSVPPEDSGPVERAFAVLDRYDWLICTSVHGVAAVAARVTAAALPGHLRLAAVGPTTAAAMTEALRSPDVVPAGGNALALAAALGPLAGQRCLLPQADIARPELAEALRVAGATVDVVVAYRTVPMDPEPIRQLAPAFREGTLDAVTFTSPSTVTNFLIALAGASVPVSAWRTSPHPPAICCIGPTTAQAARDAGLAVAAVAPEPTNVGLIMALVQALGSS